jgi:chromosome segregation ATPase
LGWIAALILPIGVFAASWWGTQLLRETNIELVAQAAEARNDLESAETQRREALDSVKLRQAEVQEFQMQVEELVSAKNQTERQILEARVQVEKLESEKKQMAAEIDNMIAKANLEATMIIEEKSNRIQELESELKKYKDGDRN